MLRPYLITACAFLPACNGPPVTPIIDDDFTLRGVPVSSDSTELRLAFGDPDSITTSENPFSSDVPLITWHYDGFEVRFAEGTLPSGWLIEAPGERTARGLGVGDPARLAERLYGRPDARLEPSWTWVYDVDPAMLRVIDVVIERDTVRRIYLGRALP